MRSWVIEDIERTGETELANGERVRIHSQVGSESGELIRRAVESACPKLGCEVGLAYGMSTLYILDAMQSYGGRLIGMDPAQGDGTWRGGGLHNVNRAGFSDRYDFHAEPSQIVLPRLAAEGTRLQFAFLDGWHTFDHTLVDFFYVDQMLDVGGIVVVDDVGYPSLRRLSRFIVTNRAYEIVGAVSSTGRTGWRTRLKRLARSALHPLLRDDQTPTRSSERLMKKVDEASLIALRKTSEDGRSFDHFVPF